MNEELIRRHAQRAILDLAEQVMWEGDLDAERQDIEDDEATASVVVADKWLAL